MKMSSLKLFKSIIGIFFALMIFSACNKNFDAPPAYQNPNITAPITTIAQLKLMHNTSGAFDKIPDTSSIIISGIVVADDYSGAFYKQIVIQDSTGAIVLLLNNKYLYLNYPLGRQVYVKCHGLYLSNDKYNGYQNLGMIDYSTPNVPASVGIPAANIPQYVIQGSTGNKIVPRRPLVNQLTTSLQDPNLGALIQLDNFEFPVADTSVNWGDSSSVGAYVTIPAKDCSGNTVNYNTSPYCSFAGVKVPNGNGSISGIYSFSSRSVNNTTRQLLLRDTSDAPLHNLRCNGTLVPPVTIYDATSVFSTITNKVQVNLSGWLNIPEVGGVYYQGFVGSTGSLASISAFGAKNPPVTSWLISPKITIPANAKSPSVSFNCIDGYDNGASFGLYISSNYDGKSLTPSTFTWSPTSYVAPSGKTSGYSALTPSGSIDLSAYKGQTIYLGFRYDGTATKSTTFEFSAPLVSSLP